jgi:hypothetical protein
MAQKLDFQRLLASRYLVTLQLLNPQSSTPWKSFEFSLNARLNTDNRLREFHCAVHVCIFPGTTY